MRKNGNYILVILQFSIALLINVMGLYTLNRVIPDSIQHLPMQAYLLFVPGILKIRDALDIWLSPGNEMRGWVYVDQSFYRMKAIDGFIFKRHKSVS